MKAILMTRWLLMKGHVWRMVCWLLFPIAFALMFSFVVQTATADSRIPIALVTSKNDTLTENLMADLKNTEYLNIASMDKDAALRALKQHKLDSVFILSSDYETKIKNGDVQQVVEGYQSDRSIAYQPVKELLLSHILKTAGRYKASETVQQLSQQLAFTKLWKKEDIIKTADDIERQENLLTSRFTFHGNGPKVETSSTNHISWTGWAIGACLATFFIFDWVVKEKQQAAFKRLRFTRYGAKPYLLGHAGLYTLLLFCSDLCFVFYLKYFTTEQLGLSFILALLSYRLTVCGIAFILATSVHKLFLYYCISLLLSLLLTLITVPLFQIALPDWLQLLNPIWPFLHQQISFIWTAILLLVLFFWLYRKEQPNA